MTWALVGMIATLAVVGAILLLVCATCLRLVINAWTSRPAGMDDAIEALRSKMEQTQLDLADVQRRYRRAYGAEMRAAQRRTKAAREGEDEIDDEAEDENARLAAAAAAKGPAAPAPSNGGAVGAARYLELFKMSRR